MTAAERAEDGEGSVAEVAGLCRCEDAAVGRACLLGGMVCTRDGV